MVKESNYEIIKFVNGEVELEVTISPYEETVWMNQEQIVKLFNSNKQNVSFHINNILNEGELELSTVKEILTVRLEGNRKVTRKIKYYNLDMIISIGYRINSKIGIMFRKWANKILKEYLLKGYVINDSGKHLTFSTPYFKRNVRINRYFGDDYSKDNIALKISQKFWNRPFENYTSKKTSKVYTGPKINKNKLKVSAFYRLYVHYLYTFGILPRKCIYTEKALNMLNIKKKVKLFLMNLVLLINISFLIVMMLKFL